MSRIVLDTALGLSLRHSERTEDQDHTHCTRSRKAAELRQTLCFLFPPLLLCRSRLPLQPLPLLPSSFSFLPQDASFQQTAAPVCLIHGISDLCCASKQLRQSVVSPISEIVEVRACKTAVSRGNPRKLTHSAYCTVRFAPASWSRPACLAVLTSRHPCKIPAISGFTLACFAREHRERMSSQEDAETNAWREHVVSSPLSCRHEYAIHHTSLVYL